MPEVCHWRLWLQTHSVLTLLLEPGPVLGDGYKGDPWGVDCTRAVKKERDKDS